MSRMHDDKILVTNYLTGPLAIRTDADRLRQIQRVIDAQHRAQYVYRALHAGRMVGAWATAEWIEPAYVKAAMARDIGQHDIEIVHCHVNDPEPLFTLSSGARQSTPIEITVPDFLGALPWLIVADVDPDTGVDFLDRALCACMKVLRCWTDELSHAQVSETEAGQMLREMLAGSSWCMRDASGAVIDGDDALASVHDPLWGRRALAAVEAARNACRAQWPELTDGARELLRRGGAAARRKFGTLAQAIAAVERSLAGMAAESDPGPPAPAPPGTGKPRRRRRHQRGKKAS